MNRPNKFRLTRRSMLAAGAAMAAVTPARAHRGAVAYTDVTWNANTGALEIVHRIHIHDGVLAVNAPDFDDPKTKARLALYVAEHFKLWTPGMAQNEPLLLEIVGAEPAGGYILVYQEILLSAAPQSLRIQCTMLHDLIENQSNAVTVALHGTTKTLTFTAEKPVQTFSTN